MSFLQQLFKGTASKRAPTPRRTLEAHVEALRERFGPVSSQGGGRGLSMLNPAGQYRVVVESGLCRVEVHCLAEREFAVSVPCHALLAEPPESAGQSGRRYVDHGLSRRDQRPNFERVVTGHSESQAQTRVVDAVETLLFELFERPREAFYSVAIEKEPEVDPEPLLESIRKLVKTKEHAVRREVYQQVINGRFYLPLSLGADAHAPPQVDALNEQFGGRPVWAVYTDLKELAQHRPSRDPHTLISGIHLVQAAMAHRIGSLKINPESRIGGELYSNELQSLAQYLTRLGVVSAGPS